MKTIKKYLLICLLGYLFIGLFQVAHAQNIESITITAPTIELNVNPRDKKEGTVGLINDSDTTLNFATSVYDFIVQDKNGTPEILPRGTITNNKYSAANWIAVYPSTFSVAPHQRYTLNYYVQIPANAGPGGHYSAIVYQPLTSADKSGTGASIHEQIASLVYISVSGNVKESAQVTKFNAPLFNEYGPVNILTEIKNAGDVHIAPAGNITIKNIFGQTVYVSALETRNIFPGNVALDYTNSVGQHFMFGRFKAELLASYGPDNNLPLYATVIFWVIPWRIITISLLVLIVIILGIILFLKNKKKKSSDGHSESNTQKTSIPSSQI